MTRMGKAAAFVIGFLLFAWLFFPSASPGSCAMKECDIIPKLLNSAGTGGCQERSEGGTIYAYGWSEENATEGLMYSPNPAGGSRVVVFNVTIGQYRKQSTSICSQQCTNIWPVRGSTVSPRSQWPFDKNVDMYTCAGETEPTP